tara:strand:+ start:438 stop:770 length:333 start_codon:yes stop_codon:yes gene_type:complete
MGDANASIPTPQPVHGRPMFSSFGKAIYPTCITFLSEIAIDAGIPKLLKLERSFAAVKDTRTISKQSMKLNHSQPNMEVDPQTYEVFADGELLTCEPAESLPLAQRYLLL